MQWGKCGNLPWHLHFRKRLSSIKPLLTPSYPINWFSPWLSIPNLVFHCQQQAMENPDRKQTEQVVSLVRQPRQEACTDELILLYYRKITLTFCKSESTLFPTPTFTVQKTREGHFWDIYHSPIPAGGHSCLLFDLVAALTHFSRSFPHTITQVQVVLDLWRFI